MSHLRPIDPETGKTKSFEQYTHEEIRTALQQLTDEVVRLKGMQQDIDPVLAQTIVRFAQRLDKGTGATNALDTIPPDVKKLAAGAAK